MVVRKSLLPFVAKRTDHRFESDFQHRLLCAKDVNEVSLVSIIWLVLPPKNNNIFSKVARIGCHLTVQSKLWISENCGKPMVEW